MLAKHLKPPPPQNIAAPLSPSSQAEAIPARKKPRRKEPLPTTADKGARKIAATPAISIGLPTPATPPSTDTVNASTRRRSRRQTELSPIERSEAQLNGDDDDAEAVELDVPSAVEDARVA
jgi:hypothetical protein